MANSGKGCSPTGGTNTLPVLLEQAGSLFHYYLVPEITLKVGSGSSCILQAI